MLRLRLEAGLSKAMSELKEESRKGRWKDGESKGTLVRRRVGDLFFSVLMEDGTGLGIS